MRRCLVVALPASADLIKAKSGPSGKRILKKEKKCRRFAGLAVSFCLTSAWTFGLHVRGVLPLWEIYFSRLTLTSLFSSPVLMM